MGHRDRRLLGDQRLVVGDRIVGTAIGDTDCGEEIGMSGIGDRVRPFLPRD